MLDYKDNRTFKIPKLQNYQSAVHLTHRHPSHTVRTTVDILKVSDFKNEKKFESKLIQSVKFNLSVDYHSPVANK